MVTLFIFFIIFIFPYYFIQGNGLDFPNTFFTKNKHHQWRPRTFLADIGNSVNNILASSVGNLYDKNNCVTGPEGPLLFARGYYTNGNFLKFFVFLYFFLIFFWNLYFF